MLSTLVLTGALGGALLWWLHAQRTTLEVTSLPSGAEVTLDGVVVGVTPLSRERSLDVGEHYRLELRLPGYDAWSSDLVASEGESRVDAILVESVGTLRVESTPAGAEVSVDGRPRGRTPLDIGSLPVDRDLRVDVTLEGYVPYTTVQQFGSARRARLTMRLAPNGTLP